MADFDFIREGHFRPIGDRQEARRLFAESVQMVEIEVFSYCNRSCWFCPNSFVDRRSHTEYMPEDIYLSVLTQLAEIDFAGTISFSRYNEPLADPIIIERLHQARTLLPRARLHTNTNGDYLTREYLAQLHQAGLRSLNIQIYLGNDERYDHERMRAKLERVESGLGLRATLVRDEPGAWLESVAGYRELDIRIYARNFDVNGCSRGDAVPVRREYQRTSPCLSPFYHFYIDYNGSVMPCCNLRSDVAAHRNAVAGTLAQTPDIFALYGSETLAGWRRSLIGFGPKAGHCASCAFGIFPETNETRTVQSALEELVSAIPSGVVPGSPDIIPVIVRRR